ncbi:MAG TPA: DUF58 domain-containing protein [Candidatus Binataceae bacterium]|nr:DUF58 domain-containing protein [Candidatus Binataceae bacterium]
MLEARAFEPDFLRRLDRLVLGVRRARTVRNGQRTIGRVQGLGIEPENFKEYNEGDDLRFLDWNAYARLDDLLIRTYRTERQVEISVLLDASASMAMPERDDKFGLARALAAAFAYIGMAENDAVRIVSFGAPRDGMKLRATPFYRRREQYQSFKPYLTELRCEGETRLSSAVGELLLQRRPAGVVVVISDFLVNQTDFEEAMLHLLGTHHEVKLVHVMGEMESEGSYPPGLYRVRDSESGEIREVAFGPELAAACRSRVAAISERLHEFCVSHAIVYAQAFGARHLDAILERELPVMGVIR